MKSVRQTERPGHREYEDHVRKFEFHPEDCGKSSRGFESNAHILFSGYRL